MPAPDDAGLDEPLVPGTSVEDASLVRRFTAEYRGRHAAEDALWWLARPADAGPSGAASPLASLQPLRAALYRSGAGAAELDAYRRAEEAIRMDRRGAWAALQAALDEPAAAARPSADRRSSAGPALPAEQVSPAARSGRRPLIVIAAALGLALVAGGGFAMLRSGSPHPSSSHPTSTGAPVVTVDAHAADLQALSATRAADLLTAAFRSMSSPAAANARNDLLAVPDASLEDVPAVDVLDDGNDSEDGAVTSGDDAYIRAHPARFGGGGTLQVHVVTEQVASWTWRVRVLNRSTRVVRTAFVVVGAQGHGQLQSASVRLDPGEVPAGMRLAVTPATPYFWSARYLY